jgi:hypothetical protein
MLQQASKKLWRRVNAAQCRQTDRDFSHGLDSQYAVADGSKQNMRTFRVVGSPSAKSLLEINQKIEEIIRLMTECVESEQRANPEDLVALTLGMAPLR